MRNDKFCQVLRELRDVGPATRQELAAALETSEFTVWHWVAQLAAWGLIRPNGHRGRAVVFELAPPGQPLGTPYRKRGTHTVDPRAG